MQTHSKVTDLIYNIIESTFLWFKQRIILSISTVRIDAAINKHPLNTSDMSFPGRKRRNKKMSTLPSKGVSALASRQKRSGCPSAWTAGLN